MGWESSGVVAFDLGPLVQGQKSIANLKVLITRLLLVLEVCDGIPTYRKSCWESSGVVAFDLGAPLQGQTSIAKLKSAYNSLIIGRRGLGWYTNI